MSLPDLPQHILFLIFLLFFVVAGIYPAWKKLAAEIRKILKKAEQSPAMDFIPFDGEPSSATYQGEQLEKLEQLSDFELFILNQLSQNSRKRMTKKQLNSHLNLEADKLKAALKSLSNKGLIVVDVSNLFRLRYALSDKGYQFAAKQGFIPQLHDAIR